MLTQPTALALWQKLGTAPLQWYLTPDGRRLTAKALRLIRQQDGRREAVLFRNLLAAASLT